MAVSEAEAALRRARASLIFELTGEPYGETEWRRWRVTGETLAEDHWHPATPQSIKDEYGWLFEFEPFGGQRDA